jgi:hypothetical protein
LNHGVFVGFHGLFNEGGTTNDENPLVFGDPATGHYFDFISNNEPGIGHLDEAVSTTDSLFLADISSTGDVFGGGGPGHGVIYQIKANAINHPPVIAPIGGQSTIEGKTLTVKVTATDPDPGQTLSYSLDPGAPQGAAIDPATGVFTWTPTEESAPVHVTVRVTDNGSPPLAATASFSIAVADAPLTTVKVPNVSTTEAVSTGSVRVAAFLDTGGAEAANHYTATIDWGDHKTSSTGQVVAGANGTFSVNGRYTYAEEGTFTITVTIRDEGGSKTIAQTKAVVADAALHSAGLATTFPATRGLSTGSLVVAIFTDNDPNETSIDYSATINWGDHSSSTHGRVVALGKGKFGVIGDHIYRGAGLYAVSVTIHDDGGSHVTVSNDKVKVK